MKKTKKYKSTYDEFVSDPRRRAMFEKEYEKLLLSEILLELMEKEKISVRQLASSSGVSSSIIQELRAGTKKNPTLRNFLRIMKTLGAEVVIKKNKKILAAV